MYKYTSEPSMDKMKLTVHISFSPSLGECYVASENLPKDLPERMVNRICEYPADCTHFLQCLPLRDKDLMYNSPIAPPWEDVKLFVKISFGTSLRGC